MQANSSANRACPDTRDAIRYAREPSAANCARCTCEELLPDRQAREADNDAVLDEQPNDTAGADVKLSLTSEHQYVRLAPAELVLAGMLVEVLVPDGQQQLKAS